MITDIFTNAQIKNHFLNLASLHFYLQFHKRNKTSIIMSFHSDKGHRYAILLDP